ncbi:MAG TPA: DNA-processing protein DprA [Solirubrobacteraceae bacterium]|nr:DNA-processing protein DprA [Solirubrobacteraceae bacterium]
MAELGWVLDRRAPDRGRLLELLGLPDEQLIAALGGSRRARLLEWRARPGTARMARPAHGAQICRHAERWPRSLSQAWAPTMLTWLGGEARLAELLDRPIVAFLDSAEASDYGRAMAASLARGATAAGGTVVAGLAGPIARAAHEGSATVGGSLAIAGDGLDPARLGASARTVLAAGCVLSELPWGAPGRIWGAIAAERIAAGLACAAVVVECGAGGRELWAARLCAHPGAVPGMVTSPLSRGPHDLLKAGAKLISGPEDLLDLLHDAGAEPLASTEPLVSPALEPELRRVADLVGAGADTVERVAAASAAGRVGPAGIRASLGALGRLEAAGTLGRTEHGRWVKLDPAGGDGR